VASITHTDVNDKQKIIKETKSEKINEIKGERNKLTRNEMMKERSN
jgi:hypothetical protein